MMIKEIMNKSVITVNHDQSISEAVSLLSKHRINELPVMKDGKFSGIISYKIIGEKATNMDQKLYNLMNNAASLGPGDDVNLAIRYIVTNDFKIVPIIDNGKLVGIVSDIDLLKMVTDKKPVKSVMSSNVHAVLDTESAATAKTKMRNIGVGRLPVIDDNGELVGMVGAVDLLKILSTDRKSTMGDRKGEKVRSEDVSIKSFIDNKIVTIDENTPIDKVAKETINKDVSFVVVLRDKKVVGVVTPKDLLTTFIKQEFSGAKVDVVGVRDQDTFRKAQIGYEIEKFLGHVEGITDIRAVKVDVKEIHGSVDKHGKYIIKAAVGTADGQSFHVERDNFKLIHCVRDVFETLAKQIKRKFKRS
jgi:CBS domain-containing protein